MAGVEFIGWVRRLGKLTGSRQHSTFKPLAA
jgi:hypothetical protein